MRKPQQPADGASAPGRDAAVEPVEPAPTGPADPSDGAGRTEDNTSGAESWENEGGNEADES